MWCSDRRLFVLGLGAALSGCGFTPVYGPGGGADRLTGQVSLADPTTDAAFLFNNRVEDRLGPATLGRYALDVTLDTSRDDVGTTSDGRRTRFQLTGTARYALSDTATGAELTSGRTESFTGYSTTGSTVATLAAERDAEARLMRILADQVVDALVIASTGFAP